MMMAISSRSRAEAQSGDRAEPWPVHFTDGAAGTRKRLAVAERHAKAFSIATECGFGRRDPKTIPELLRIHAEVAG
jgi:hypothetical protein